MWLRQLIKNIRWDWNIAQVFVNDVCDLQVRRHCRRLHTCTERCVFITAADGITHHIPTTQQGFAPAQRDVCLPQLLMALHITFQQHNKNNIFMHLNIHSTKQNIGIQQDQHLTVRNDRLGNLWCGQKVCHLARLRQVDNRLCWERFTSLWWLLYTYWTLNSRWHVHVSWQLI